MRYSLALALFFLSTGITLAEQQLSGVVPVSQTEIKTQESIAIQKSLILATLLQEEECSEESTLNTAEKNMLRCAEFAKSQGAPSAFVKLLEASAKQTTLEESEVLAQKLDEILNQYNINISLLYVWASIFSDQADDFAKIFNGDTGSELIKSELLAADERTIRALPKEQFQSASDAIKKSMLMLYFLTIEDKQRISDEHMAQVLVQAEKWGAPKMFIRLLSADASRTIAPNLRYEVNAFLTSLFESYMIDRTALRLYAELSPLTATQIIELLNDDGVVKSYTVTPAFNLLPVIDDKLTDEQLQELSLTWLMDVRGLAETLASITVENADKANLAAISSKIPSYFRVKSIQNKLEPNLINRINGIEEHRTKQMLTAIYVAQQQIERLLRLKSELPIPLQALLAQFI